PATRQPGAAPRRNRCVRGVALSPGWRVVALGGGRRDVPPWPPLRQRLAWLVIPEIRRPAEEWFFPVGGGGCGEASVGWAI
ncbi:MAG TPA: hypothetical protein VFO16_10530, partial [Pseudonocardiaceae bacterium]|nr:hypothetical protein [Pseudonocardiaceae bacterium]